MLSALVQPQANISLSETPKYQKSLKWFAHMDKLAAGTSIYILCTYPHPKPLGSKPK